MCVLVSAKTQTAAGTVSNTHPSTLFTASAVLKCNAKRNLTLSLTLRVQFLYDTDDHVDLLSYIIYIVKYMKDIDSAR